MKRHHRAVTRAVSRAAMRGVAAVEFGFLIIPLVLLALGAAEFGRAIYSYNTLDKQVRDAARHLSQHGPGDTVIQTDAKNIAVCGYTDCIAKSAPPAAPGLTLSMVDVCDSMTCPSTHVITVPDAGTVSLVSVVIRRYEYVSLFGITLPSLSGPGFTFRNLRFNDIGVTMRGLP